MPLPLLLLIYHFYPLFLNYFHVGIVIAVSKITLSLSPERYTILIIITVSITIISSS